MTDLHIRIPDELASQIKKQAKLCGRSLNSEIAWMIRRCVDRIKSVQEYLSEDAK